MNNPLAALANIVSLGFNITNMRKLLRSIPDSIGAGLVEYESKHAGLRQESHITIRNLAPLTLHGVRLEVRSVTRNQTWDVRSICKRGVDAFGQPVTYEIKIGDEGFFLRPGEPYFVLASHLTDSFKSSDQLAIGFSYVTSDGSRHKGRPQPITRVCARPDCPPEQPDRGLVR